MNSADGKQVIPETPFRLALSPGSPNRQEGSPEAVGRFRPQIEMFHGMSFKVLQPEFGIIYSKTGGAQHSKELKKSVYLLLC